MHTLSHQLSDFPCTSRKVLRLLLRKNSVTGREGRRRRLQRLLEPPRRGGLLLVHGSVGVERQQPAAQLALQHAQRLSPRNGSAGSSQ